MTPTLENDKPPARHSAIARCLRESDFMQKPDPGISHKVDGGNDPTEDDQAGLGVIKLTKAQVAWMEHAADFEQTKTAPRPLAPIPPPPRCRAAPSRRLEAVVQTKV